MFVFPKVSADGDRVHRTLSGQLKAVTEDLSKAGPIAIPLPTISAHKRAIQMDIGYVQNAHRCSLSN